MTDNRALYRKYRPADFKEVRDQDHVVSVLEGAIAKGTIPHSLIFSGTRGTGKTTLARIFARAVGVSDVDIYEIDAASNNGVDEIRALREAAHTLPYESPYKVYILDEAHMLSKSAFNALLKTLEEPPAHVIFILATTEEDKLLDTIKSRCQVFRLNSPSRPVLKETVVDVAKKEKFQISPAAADLIAIAADGSFRDALSILQKVIMSSSDAVGEVDEVARIIGAPRTELLIRALKGLAAKDAEASLTVVSEAVTAGIDIKLFLRLFLERIRAIILLRNLPSKKEELLNMFSEEEAKIIEELSGESGSSINSHTLLRLLSASMDTARSPIPQLPLEVAIIDLCQRQS